MIQLGTEASLKDFITMQVEVYKVTLQRQYGLPDVDTYPSEIYDVSFFTPKHIKHILKSPPEDEASYAKRTFVKETVVLFGVPIRMWFSV